ncbi:MAG TPA: response regulator transcription factor [Verrucomicrobiota bacterium]|jgi:DNA-binding NarL/FixJ family response regulator|nr:response regulator transcription factor [Verrucomicrobiota bacterium]OQC26597.1 MAG: Transcriptional regulatory protein LiaR [Verrucomicrobia bacterium ADurb.Bin063]HCL92919.1 DNA-binding response regulator [Limisphaerales bacterium]HRR63832.1 response regulator transcription factor [Candidatus Paceibacterota bacterium]MBP8014481.1 response regulator transcription factor [Verrucomicrobiota bacterium]
MSTKSGKTKKVTVLLADDHIVVRQGLRALLEAEGDIEVVGEAKDGREAVSLARQTQPEVVLMDVAMPELNGLEATRQIVRELPGTKVLALSSYGNDDYVTQLLEAGGVGYLVKQTAAADLLKAIRQVRKGQVFFSPMIAQRLQAGRPGTPGGGRPGNKHASLSSREAEVLQLVAEGFANKQIAAKLSISIKTVEKHRQQAMNKLNIHDTAGLTRYAISRGWVESGV